MRRRMVRFDRSDEKECSSDDESYDDVSSHISRRQRKRQAALPLPRDSIIDQPTIRVGPSPARRS